MLHLGLAEIHSVKHLEYFLSALGGYFMAGNISLLENMKVTQDSFYKW